MLVFSCLDGAVLPFLDTVVSCIWALSSSCCLYTGWTPNCTPPPPVQRLDNGSFVVCPVSNHRVFGGSNSFDSGRCTDGDMCQLT